METGECHEAGYSRQDVAYRRTGWAGDRSRHERRGKLVSTGTVTVLIVDDDAVFRHLVAEVVAGMGYSVRTAEGGIEALAMLDSAPHINVLLTDVTMPVMSGPRLALKARQMRPALAVIFMSGNAEPSGEALDDAAEAPMEPLLLKPFRLNQLAEQIEAALGRKAQPA